MLKRRRLPILFAVLAVVGLTASGCGSSAAAVRVGDDYISQSDFEDQLDAVYENEALREQILRQQVPASQLRGEDDPPGSYPQSYVGSMLGVQLDLLVLPEVLDELGIEITDDDREQLHDQAKDALGDDVFDGLSDGMRDRYLDYFFANQALQQVDQDEISQAVEAVFDADDVAVNSRYGTFDATTRQLTPPPGPNPAPGADPEGLSLE